MLTHEAQCAYPDKKIVAVVGDSAFGFRCLRLPDLANISAMEIETAVRSKLPLLVYVINNNGIYHGLDAKAYEASDPLPSTSLSPDTRYDLIAEVHISVARHAISPSRLVDVEDTLFTIQMEFEKLLHPH